MHDGLPPSLSAMRAILQPRGVLLNEMSTRVMSVTGVDSLDSFDNKENQLISLLIPQPLPHLHHSPLQLIEVTALQSAHGVRRLLICEWKSDFGASSQLSFRSHEPESVENQGQGHCCREAAMESNAGSLCSDLPNEIIERVLSFLPVPTSCRLRTVCKSWNDLTRKPGFHDLCDLNGSQKHKSYLFVTRYLMYWYTDDEGQLWYKFVDALRRPLRILDLETNRWYTIPTHIYSRGAPAEDFGARLLAMNDGLICELTGKYKPTLLISDLVAATRRQLPPAPTYWPTDDEPLPVIAMAVDPVLRTYRVGVIISNDEYEQYNCAYVYESSTNRWHKVKPVYMRALSAVFFRNVLYVVYADTHTGTDFTLKTSNLVSLDDEQMTSIPPPGHVSIPSHPRHPRLFVSGGRLCMMQWGCQLLDPPDGSFEFAQSNSVLDVVEIMVDSELHHDTRSLVHMTSAQLGEWFGEQSVQIACAIPMFGEDSSGDCLSVVLMSEKSGTIVRRDLVSGAVQVWPAHPFGPDPASSPLHPDKVPVEPNYVGKLTTLSLRHPTL